MWLLDFKLTAIKMQYVNHSNIMERIVWNGHCMLWTEISS